MGFVVASFKLAHSPQPNTGHPGEGDLILAFLGDAGVVGRVDMAAVGMGVIMNVFDFDAPLNKG